MNITAADYNSWLHHPVSKVMQQFMNDYKEMLVKELVAQWQSGVLKLSTEEEIKGRVKLIDDFLELRYEHIEAFYGAKDSNTGQTAEIR